MARAKLNLVIQHPIMVAADALIIEDSGWLTGTKGVAADADARGGPALQAARAALVVQHGPLPLGSAWPTTSGGWAAHGGPQTIIHAITYTYSDVDQTPATRINATPLNVGRATLRALEQAAACGARHVALPPLGVRTDYHQLPPHPKNLVRYVMAAVQLQAIAQIIANTTLEQITVALTDRGHAIWQEVLGTSEL